MGDRIRDRLLEELGWLGAMLLYTPILYNGIVYSGLVRIAFVYLYLILYR